MVDVKLLLERKEGFRDDGRVWRCRHVERIDTAMFQIMEGQAADHGGVVRAEFRRCEKDGSSCFRGVVGELCTQVGIAGDTATEADIRSGIFARGGECFRDEHIHDGGLIGGQQIGQVAIGDRSGRVDGVQQGGFDT